MVINTNLAGAMDNLSLINHANELLRQRADEAQRFLDGLRQTSVNGADVSGPLPSTTSSTVAEMMQAGTKYLNEEIRKAAENAANLQGQIAANNAQAEALTRQISHWESIKNAWQSVKLDPIQLVTGGALTGAGLAVTVESTKAGIKRVAASRPGAWLSAQARRILHK